MTVRMSLKGKSCGNASWTPIETVPPSRSSAMIEADAQSGWERMDEWTNG
jgi:hypothetical protein